MVSGMKNKNRISQTVLLFIFMVLYFPIAKAEKGSCMVDCIREHPKWGLPICQELGSFYKKGINCYEILEVKKHRHWGLPSCSEIGEYHIKGPACFEIHNECFQRCYFTWFNEAQKYVPKAGQVGNQWRQGKVCSSDVKNIPLNTLPGNHLIDPRLSGYCECLNGKWLEASCGHKKVSCDMVCNQDQEF